jgi:hypothetical protein
MHLARRYPEHLVANFTICLSSIPDINPNTEEGSFPCDYGNKAELREKLKKHPKFRDPNYRPFGFAGSIMESKIDQGESYANKYKYVIVIEGMLCHPFTIDMSLLL